MTINRKDVAYGMFFVAAGLFYGTTAIGGLPMGEALNMGPGYFAIVLSGILIMLGLATAIRGLVVGPGTPFGIVPWRAIVFLTLSILVFAATFRQLGMLLGVFV